MICGYVRCGFVKEVVDLFFEMMKSEDVRFNLVMMVCVIFVCVKFEDFEICEKVYVFISSFGVEVNDVMVSVLVDMYMKCNDNNIVK